MDIPRFDQNRDGGNNIGDAFQRFAYDLLLFDHPGLHFFPTRGKDGGIDLSRTKDGSRLVVECKYIGTDGVSTALSRWREVARNLRTHLAEPEEAAQHEAQYGPWYITDPVITEYIFCVSSELGNQEQQDEVQREIAGFFAEMSSRHAHLAHLSKLSVTILDWNDLTARLRNRPFVLFRWFKLLRDYGLATLNEVTDRTTFRSYLYSDKLPYYSRRQQLDVVPIPPGTDIPDEDGLLRLIEGDSLTGLILTGGGGVGKTRLTLEIGYLAQSKGWVVLRVLRRLKEDALEHLARWVTPETKVLLLIDYVETQRDFDELMNELNDLNDSLNLHVRYVANCRTSYYRSIAAISRHRDINLSPALEDPALVLWFESYLRQTVRHILERNDMEVTEQHLYVCRDIPVLAVFMSYLHGMGREPELQTLLAEKNFARWIVRRLELTFPDSPVFPNLAQLAALFPIPSAVAHHPDLKDHQESFDRLAADGWIEKLPADDEYKTEMWRAAHDVFADQILLFYFESIPHTVEKFVRELLSLARRVGCLRSALTTLQRIVDKPALKVLDWPGILDSAISEDPRSWRDVRDLLVRTSLLTNPQRINLLGKHEEVWQGAEEETGFQLAVGWFIRRVIEQEDTERNESQRSILESWIKKAASHTAVNNYILTSGLKFCPELVQEAALNWILTRPREFQTHYLIVAWLNQKLPLEAIRLSVEQWAMRFSDNFHLSFIVRAWLTAGGDKELLRTPIESWLPVHKIDVSANFVYKSWLDAGGGTETVKDSIAAWLAAHKTNAHARFVYQAWLDAGGGTEVVQDFLLAWLNAHKTLTEASFIYYAWLKNGGSFSVIRMQAIKWLSHNYDKEGADFLAKLLAKQPDIPVETVKNILKWCSKFPTNEDAFWRLTQLRKHLLNKEVAEEVLAASEAVLNQKLSTDDGLLPVVNGQITTLFAFLIEASGFRAGRLRSGIDELLLRWLRHPASYGDDPKPHPNVERISYVERFADLIDSGALSVVADRELMERFLWWVNNWRQSEWRDSLRPLLARLEREHPAPGLWDIVKFKERAPLKSDG
jgi:hypothetical protein